MSYITNSKKTYEARGAAHPHALVRQLLTLMSEKRTNLCLSADVTTTSSLLALADSIGPYIAVLKTHMDILVDFSASTIPALQALSEKHNFLLFEDRKFVDIGNTAMLQYRGSQRIVEWAHFVNACVLAGEGTIKGLEKLALTPEYAGRRALLLLAEMTSEGSLATGKYTQRAISLAHEHKEFVVGYIAHSPLIAPADGAEVDMLTFTTGINRISAGDSLLQKYRTPKEAVAGGSDVVIVGRGLYENPDPVGEAKAYRDEAWKAYEERVGLA